MRHILFYLLFGTAFHADAQFAPGTDFYNRNREICDSINKFKATGYRWPGTDSIGALNIGPMGDSTKTYRYGISDKMAVARWLTDSTGIAASLATKLSTIDTTNIANFYLKVRSEHSAGTGITYNATTGQITNSAPVVSKSFNNTPSVTIQTVAASANGDQLSGTRDAHVSYSVTIVSTATISGAQSGYVALEICATNSSTAASWIEIGRCPNGQAVSLAVVLQSVSTGGGNLNGIVPAGFFRRLRSVNSTGTPGFTYNSGQEVLY